jgi:thymidylate synthase (FAD)
MQVIKMIEWEQTGVYGNYEELIEKGIARELARINLPLSLYTEWYWQIDLHNLFHFLGLRLDQHAQYEIRQYAKVLAQCAQAVAPLAYGAFEEFVLHGARMSRRELKAIRKMLESGKKWGPDSDLSNVTKLAGRKRDEFVAKLWKVTQPDAAAEIKPVTREEPDES